MPCDYAGVIQFSVRSTFSSKTFCLFGLSVGTSFESKTVLRIRLIEATGLCFSGFSFSPIYPYAYSRSIVDLEKCLSPPLDNFMDSWSSDFITLGKGVAVLFSCQLRSLNNFRVLPSFFSFVTTSDMNVFSGTLLVFVKVRFFLIFVYQPKLFLSRCIGTISVFLWTCCTSSSNDMLTSTPLIGCLT